MRKGQGAFEYVMIVGIAMLIIVPGALIFYNYSMRSSDELTRSRIEMAGNDIVDSVEKVYYIGENSWETIEVNLPENVRWIYILSNSELVIEYDSSGGMSRAVFFSDVNMTTPYRILNKNYISDVPSDPENMIPGLTLSRLPQWGTMSILLRSRNNGQGMACTGQH